MRTEFVLRRPGFQLENAISRQSPAKLHRRASRYVAILAFALAALPTGCAKKEVSAAVAPEVEVAGVIQQDVPLYTEWISTLDGYVNAQIQPQVTGYLMKQNYQEGTVVHKGQLLFEIDPRPFEAALEQVKGQLAQAEAQLGKTKLDVARDTPLAKESAIPQAQLDNDIQAHESAQAVVAAAKAQVEQARLNLSFTLVRSLVDGIAGLAKGQIGDLVGPTTLLTTVSQVEPIKAYFVVGQVARRAEEYERVRGLAAILIFHVPRIFRSQSSVRHCLSSIREIPGPCPSRRVLAIVNAPVFSRELARVAYLTCDVDPRSG
jgi:multidrug efflux pump subunit AcrA (membrane-fusion protein)